MQALRSLGFLTDASSLMLPTEVNVLATLLWSRPDFLCQLPQCRVVSDVQPFAGLFVCPQVPSKPERSYLLGVRVSSLASGSRREVRWVGFPFYRLGT